MDNLSDAACGSVRKPLRPRGIKTGATNATSAQSAKKMVCKAWVDLKRNVARAEELTAKMVEALATQQWAVVDTLVKQQQRWLDNLEGPRATLDQFHSAEPKSPQQPEGN
jgi:hypothetical protein